MPEPYKTLPNVLFNFIRNLFHLHGTFALLPCSVRFIRTRGYFEVRSFETVFWLICLLEMCGYVYRIETEIGVESIECFDGVLKSIQEMR